MKVNRLLPCCRMLQIAKSIRFFFVQIAVEHGFGGGNSRQKAQNFENDIVEMFRKKGKFNQN